MVSGMADGGEGAVDGLFDERVVGAAEQKGLGGGGSGEGFGEVDAEDFVGDGVVGPAFFDERDEQGAGLFGGFEAEGVAGRGCRRGIGRWRRWRGRGRGGVDRRWLR